MSNRYLLFAGLQHPPNGGLGDLLDTFASEDAARRAFREVRLRTSSPDSWAQLAVVDADQGIKPLCWFGIGAEPDRYRPHIGSPLDPPVASPAPAVGRPRAVARVCLALALACAAIGDTGLIKVGAGITVLVCALVIVLLTREEAGRAYR